jgi:hypothetical protein
MALHFARKGHTVCVDVGQPERASELTQAVAARAARVLGKAAAHISTRYAIQEIGPL